MANSHPGGASPSMVNTGKTVAHTQYPTAAMKENAATTAARQKIDENFKVGNEVKNTSNNQLTPDQHYQKLYAQKNTQYEKNISKRDILASSKGSHRQESADHDIGKQMIKDGRKKEEVAQAIHNCSPRAAGLEHTHGKGEKQAYSKNMADICDIKVQGQNMRAERSKTVSHEPSPSQYDEMLAMYQARKNSPSL